METRHFGFGSFPGIRVLAAAAVLSLFIIAFVQGYSKISKGGVLSARNAPLASPGVAQTPSGSIDWQTQLTTDTVSALDPDGISNIGENVMGALLGSYATLAENGSYTSEEGKKVAEDIAASLKARVSYKAYGTADLKTDADTSYERMLAYRGDLRIALEPLLENPGYELSIFANYIESRDSAYLDQLKGTSKNYRAAIANAALLSVPEDAASRHAEILNALSEFVSVVERLTEHADDPFASAALLRTYNESEANLVVSFNKLAEYYRSKKS